MTSTPANERSRASTLSNTSTSHPRPPASLSPEDAADWLAIERALGHIQSVIASDPYVLTIPQDIEPRYRHQIAVQARQWLDHTPFSDREHEASQYLTWHFHEPGDMYVLHSTRPREERDEPGSQVTTPRVGSGSGGARKAMSLGAYKKKVAGATPGLRGSQKAGTSDTKEESAGQRRSEGEKTVKKPAVKGPIERVKADEEVLAAVENDEEDLVPSVTAKRKVEDQKDLKRKRQDEQNENVRPMKRTREDSKTSEQRENKVEAEVGRKDRTEDRKQPAYQSVKQDERSATREARSARPPSPEVEQSAAKKAKTWSETNGSAKGKDKTGNSERATAAKRSTSPAKPVSPPPKLKKEALDVALPPRLSPLRETSSKDFTEGTSLLLPPRLSPTLPENITATLDARKHHRSTPRSSAAGDVLTTPRISLEHGITKRKSPVNGFRANSSSPMVRSDPEDSRGRRKTAEPRVRSPSLSGQESEIALGKSSQATKKDGKPKLLARLKFKQRGTREAVKQLLRLAPVKNKPDAKPSPVALKATDARHREQRDTNAKGVAQKIGPATKGAVRKVEKASTAAPSSSKIRARGEESEKEERAVKQKKADIAVYEPPAKRKKQLPELPDLKTSNAPATPVQPPPTPVSSAQKPAPQPTPSLTASIKAGKELLAAATTSGSVKRETSHESQGQVPTPSATSSSPAASLGPQPQASNAPKSTPATSTPASTQTKTPRQQEWERTRKTLEDLGRELKRAATADVTTATDSSRRLAAVKSIESLLVYILAFVSADEASLAADPRQAPRTGPWRSLRDYFPFVKGNAEPFPALQGLSCALAVVFCARVVDLCVEEKSGNAEVLAHAWGMLARSAADAEVKLDVKSLQAIFPAVWRGSAEGAIAIEEKLEPGRFAGAYKLPLGVHTKPVSAVRAAHAMLQEWIAKQGVQYEMKLKLDLAV